MSNLTESQIARINEIMQEGDNPDEPTVVTQWEPKKITDPAYRDIRYHRSTLAKVQSTINRVRITENLARLVHELGGEAKYGDADSYYIYISVSGNILSDTTIIDNYYPESVLMTQKCVKEICAMHKQGRLNFLNPPTGGTKS